MFEAIKNLFIGLEFNDRPKEPISAVVFSFVWFQHFDVTIRFVRCARRSSIKQFFNRPIHRLLLERTHESHRALH